MAVMDVERVRACFPALAQNKGFVFADNAGGSQVLECVVERMSEYMLGSNVQMADYPYAHRAQHLVANGTSAAALFAGTKAENIMFGASATQLFETLSRLMEAKVAAKHSESSWSPETEIIITAADHEANRGAWLRMASRLNLTVKTWNPSRLDDSTAPTNVGLAVDELESLVTPQTRLVAVTASSNVLGSHFTDKELQRICQLVKEKSKGKAYTVFDAVAFAPHMRLRPEQWGADFVVWSWYKVFGPHLACMYLSPRSRSESGIIGKLNHHFLQELQGTMYAFQPSSIQYELVASIAGVVDYLLWLGGFHLTAGPSPLANDYSSIDDGQASTCLDRSYRLFSEQEQELAKSALARLNCIPGLSILGDPQPTHAEARAPTIAFCISGQHSKQVHARMVKSQEMGAQVGHMYAYALIQAVSPPLDVEEGVVRISFVHYNTQAEVDKVCDIIAKEARR